jgi:putative endopeptidase
MRRTAFLVAILLCAFAASATADTGKPVIGPWGVDLSGIDKGVRPGDNFYLYVNGTWQKNAVIPADRPSIGSFQMLRVRSEDRMKEIAAGLEAKPYDQLSTEEKKLRDLYDAFIDTDQIEARGLDPVKKDLAYLASLRTYDDVARAMASVPLATSSVFNVNITYDPKNPDAYVLIFHQSGLGMPDRDYYLRDDKDIAATREAYKKYLADMLALDGLPDAATRAQKIFDVETEIAKVQWTRADRRDSTKTYNPMTISQLKALTPEFPWDVFLAEEGISETGKAGERHIVVAENTAFPPIAKIFRATPIEVWRDYLTVHYLHTFSAYLPKRFDDEDFSFYGTALQGNGAQLDRKTRAVHLLDNIIGEALGKLYVARFFPPEAKAKAETLVSNILKAYEADIGTLTWMSPATRQKALDKIHQFTPHIGYPDAWRDYSAYVVTRDDLIGDVQRGAEFEWNRELKRIDDPVDKSEWDMTPPTVNAYYQRSLNGIFFPAAILQPPFFDPNADDAVNYGGIGAVIGHEISHGFDDQGSKYNGLGALEDWWTDDDRKAFDARTTVLSDQFDTYEPLPGLHVIGRNTLGEDIADLAGLNIALKAYHISLNGQPAPLLDGFTGDQRFFLSFGQIWRTKMRDSALRTLVLSDPHAPGLIRPIAATRNTDAWYDAFGVQPGDKYYLPPDQRVRLW